MTFFFLEKYLVDNEGHARLTDFSDAKVIEDENYTTAQSSPLAGSIAYMAPELFSSNVAEVDVGKMFMKQVDVYASAMVCFKVSQGI